MWYVILVVWSQVNRIYYTLKDVDEPHSLSLYLDSNFLHTFYNYEFSQNEIYLTI